MSINNCISNKSNTNNPDIITNPLKIKNEFISYSDAGVNINLGNKFVENIKPLAKSTDRTGVMGSVGGFGGLFDTRAVGYKDPIIVSATDGVETKLIIAQLAGKHDTIGIDLVAMIVNDIIVQGAEPLFFLDYFATGKLKISEAQEVIAGIANGCCLANCALIGGETAEMPGLYKSNQYDLAGFGVGAVERLNLLPKLEKIVAGDAILGLPSSGIHANGFSLVRKIIERTGVALDKPAPFQADGAKLADVLLAPTRLYVKSCLAATRSGKVKALCHITGGGLLENIPRILPDTVIADIDATNWTPPPVFDWLARGSGAGTAEMLRTFNCGIGMVLVVASSDIPLVTDILKDNAEPSVLILGTIMSRTTGDIRVNIQNTSIWGWLEPDS